MNTMYKSKAIAWACLSFTAGVLLGVLISPVKGGFGNNTTYATHHHYVDEKQTDKKD